MTSSLRKPVPRYRGLVLGMVYRRPSCILRRLPHETGPTEREQTHEYGYLRPGLERREITAEYNSASGLAESHLINVIFNINCYKVLGFWSFLAIHFQRGRLKKYRSAHAVVPMTGHNYPRAENPVSPLAALGHIAISLHGTSWKAALNVNKIRLFALRIMNEKLLLSGW